ncbi:MAG: tetratricopeptide repeat protein [Acidobacteriia bacterium]|nr:tetratricopeptide repeat protein [Terriglobia bacterium]
MAATALSGSAAADSGVIHLVAPSPEPEGERPAENGGIAALREGRRGFDFDTFQSRLEGAWFQRKGYLADSRDADASRQSELIRAFCAEEDIHRVEGAAAALVAEARRYLGEGSHEKALRSLELADVFDPSASQIHLARASVLWKSGGGLLRTGGELFRAAKAQLREAWTSLGLVNDLALVLVFALLGCLAAFSLLLVLRHQVAVRHEVEEEMLRRGAERWAPAAGWALLLLPLLSWIAAGWIALYWLVVTFRVSGKAERLVATVLLLGAFVSVPAYRVAVAIYGLTADPVVRTSLAAASGRWDPDRVVKMRELVEAHPEQPIYRFLLAGLYKNGRYYEEAYREYKQVLALDPDTYHALVNLGNIFFHTGQYSEAAVMYKRAIAVEPESILAYYDLHLAQSEAFNFKEAETSLNRARDIDPKAIADLLSRHAKEGDRPTVVDAGVGVGTIVRATLSGGQLKGWLESGRRGGPGREIALQFLNPTSVVALLALVAALVALLSSVRQRPARRCARCGRPFCHLCKSARDANDYCTQCVHLFVLGDGLAPETKTRKLYEIERHDRMNRFIRRIASTVLPGAGDVLKGKPALGALLLFLWLTAWIAWLPELFVPIQRFTGADLRLDLLRSGSVPASFPLCPAALVCAPLAAAVWLAGNLRQRRRFEA